MYLFSKITEQIKSNIRNISSRLKLVSSIIKMYIEAPGDEKAAVVVDRMSFNYYECDYGVKDIHFTLYPGDRVLLIGHNGCGKSTLLSLIGGKRKATSGSITVLGVDAFEETGLNHRVALLGPPWPPEAYFANTVDSVASPAPHPKRKEAIATHLHLPLSAAVDKMSSGEKRRVQILHGMLHEAEVLLLDECSTDIDVAERKTVLDLVKRECTDTESTIGDDSASTSLPECKGHVRKQRACCIYATHILDGVEGWATHVALMDNQRIIDFRKIEEVSLLNYSLPEYVLKTTPHSALTTDGRGDTHSAAAARVHAAEQLDNATGEGISSPTATMSLEQYAHAFISKNRSREKKYRCYLTSAGHPAGIGPDSSTAIQLKDSANKEEKDNDNAIIATQQTQLSSLYSSEFIIRCRNISIPNIFRSANIDIKRGSRTLLLGCNGSGKSTLLNIWGGKRLYLQKKGPTPHGADGATAQALDTHPDGMYLNGSEMYKDMRAMIEATTYGGDWWTKVPGGEMHVWDLVPQPITLRAFDIANLLQINWSWDVRYLSAGEQKRVQLLLGMQIDRPLVILDEATADLDVDQRHELLKFLFLESVQKGTTVLYTTHIFEGLSGWPTEIVFLDKTIGGVHSSINIPTFADAEDPQLFRTVTERLVMLKSNEPFVLR